MNGIEDRLQGLMMRSLAGEAAAHRDLLVEQAAQPTSQLNGARLHTRLPMLAAPFVSMMTLAWIELARTPEPERVPAWLGPTWISCPAHGLHCPEWSAAFVATWYALGIFISGALGAIAGRFVLKW